MKIAIYRHQLFTPSETFITSQVENVPHIQPMYVGTEQVGAAPKNAHVFTHCSNKILQRITRKNSMLLRYLQRMQPQLLHAHFGFDAVYALALAQQLSIPLVTTFHGSDATLSTAELLSKKKIAWLMYVLRRSELQKKGHVFLCVSNYMRTLLLQLGFPEEKTLTHYTGVDTTFFSRTKPYSFGNTIVHIARLVEKKGTALLLHAISHIIPQLRPKVIIIGDGPQRAELQRLAIELHIAHYVEFKGVCSREEVRTHLNNALILCAPSESEGLGQVLLEAQAMEIPVVASFLPAFQEALIEDKSGILVREKSPEAYAAVLTDLLQDTERAKKMGQCGQKFVAQKFDIVSQGMALSNIYTNLINHA